MKRILLPVICLSLLSPVAMARDAQPANKYDMNRNQNTMERMDPIDIILKDHTYITQQFAMIDKNLDSNAQQSRNDFKGLKEFLIKHEMMEQKSFYPELDKNKDLKDIITQLKEEEDAAAQAIKKLDGIKDNAEWVQAYRKFKQDVMNHANEEQSKLFPKVRQAMNPDQLHEIGKKMMDYRKKNKMNETEKMNKTNAAY